MDRTDQEQALAILETIVFHVDRLPGEYRDTALRYITHQRETLKADTRRASIEIVFRSGLCFWEVEVDGDLRASIKRNAKGMAAVFHILHSDLPSQPVRELLRATGSGSSKYPASTLQKQIKRARDILRAAGAKALADYIEGAVEVSNSQQVVRYRPQPGFVVRTEFAGLDRS